MELAIGQLIKMIIGVVVIIAVLGGLFLIANYAIDFFGNVLPENISNQIMFLLK